MEVNLFKLSWERSLNLSFTNIRDLHFDFLACESFLKSKLLIFLLYVRQTWKTQLSRVGFCYSYACSYSLHEGVVCFCTRRFSSKLCRFLCFQLALLQTTLIRFLTYPLDSVTVILLSHTLQDYFQISDASLDHLIMLSQFPHIFLETHRRMLLFIG